MKKTLLFTLLLWSVSMALFAQTDTVPPALSCKTAVTKQFEPICISYFWKNELIESLSDNTTPFEAIETGLRRQCVGSGFPTGLDSVPLIEDGIYVPVEVWARDQAGNISMCMTNILAQDNLGICGNPNERYIMAVTPEGDYVYRFEAFGKGHNCLNETFESYAPPNDNFWATVLYVPAPVGYDFYITPSKNINPLNGIDQQDIQLIYDYLSGTIALTPFQLIAADTNQDGSVSISDVIVLRKLLLGFSNHLPNGKSWRFVPQSYIFSNPGNPFQPPFPERAIFSNQLYSPQESYFIAVKIGDVNGSADPEN